MRIKDSLEKIGENYIKNRGIEPRGFLKDYSDGIRKVTNCHPDVAYACAMTVLSSVTDQYAIPSANGPKKLNLCHFIVADSDPMISIAFRLVEKTLRSVEERIRMITQNPYYRLIGPNGNTRSIWEGYHYADWGKNYERHRRNTVLIDQGNDYSIQDAESLRPSSIELHCILLEGSRTYRPFWDSEANVDTEYVTYLGTAPDGIHNLGRNFNWRGVGDQMQYVLVDEPNLQGICISEEVLRDRMMSFELDNYRDFLSLRMQSGPVSLRLSKTADETWTEYQRAMDEKIREYLSSVDGGYYHIYAKRLQENTLKMAGLAAISRSAESARPGQHLEIDHMDISWATDRTDAYIGYHDFLVHKVW